MIYKIPYPIHPKAKLIALAITFTLLTAGVFAPSTALGFSPESALSAEGSLHAEGSLPAHQGPVLLKRLPHLSPRSLTLWMSESQLDLQKIERDLIADLQKKPRSAFTHFHLCLYYLKLMELHQENADNHRFLQKASQMARQIMILHPQNMLGYLGFGYIAHTMGETSEALKILHLLRQMNQTLPPESFYLAAQLIAQFHVDGARDSFAYRPFLNDLLTSNAISSQTLLFLLKPLIHAQKDDILFEPAAPIALQAGKNPERSSLSAEGSLTAEGSPLAEGSFAPLQKRRPASYAFIKARLLAHQGKTQLAAQFFEKALQLGLKSPDLYLHYAVTITRINPKKALKLLQLAHSHPLPKSKEDQMVYSWHKGLAHLYSKDTLSAQKTFLPALHSISQDNDLFAESLLKSLSQEYANLGLTRPLISFLKKVKVHVPELVIAHKLLGTSYLKAYQPYAAIAHLKDALIFDRDNPTLHSKLGIAYYRNRNLPAAPMNEFYSAFAPQPWQCQQSLQCSLRAGTTWPNTKSYTKPGESF